MILKSPAKINLFLRIVGKKPDGYHLLESLFAPINLFDEITIEPSSVDQVVVLGATISQPNIVQRAMELLKPFAHNYSPLKITIDKKIPIGGGLGGGSANAAIALNALKELWSVQITDEQMNLLALKLGADVPFFLHSKPAFVEGVGEVITPVVLEKSYPILVVNPGIHVDTGHIFKMGIKQFSPYIEFSEDQIFNGCNDLTNNAVALEPGIGELLSNLAAQEGCVLSRMSGSGSSCFGIFDTLESAQKAQKNFNYFSHVDLIKTQA